MKLKTKCTKKNPNAELIAEPLSDKHFKFFKKINSNKQVHKMLGTRDPDHWVWTSREFFDAVLRGGPAYVWVYDKEPVGISFSKIEYGNAISIAIALLPEFWRKGFGIEILRKSLFEFKQLGFKKITAEIHPSNKKAISLAIIHGFKFHHMKYFKHSDPHAIYELNLEHIN